VADGMHNPPKQAPHSIDAEMSTLGGMMLNNDAIDEVRDLLTEGDFYMHAHQLVYAVILDLATKGQPVDFLTVKQALIDNGKLEEAGGIAYIGTLANDTPSAANVVPYAQRVLEKSRMRGLIATGQRIADIGFRPEGRTADELLEEAQSLVAGIQRDDADGGMQEIGAGVDEWNRDLEERTQSQRGGMSTPWTELTDAIAGIEDGDLIIVGGRPGTGKTTFALQLAEHIASRYGPAGGFSLEMPTKQWLSSLVAALGRVNAFLLRTPHMLSREDWDNVARATGVVRTLPFYVDDRSANIQQLRQRARKLQRKLKRKGLRLRVLVVDFIQKAAEASSRSSNRAEQVKMVSDGLKKLGKELGCAIIAISQNSRDQEKAPTPRPPRMSDLAEGNIESDADIVIMLHRPILADENYPWKDLALAIICKQRSGPLKTVDLKFEGEYRRYADWDGPTREERAEMAKPSGTSGGFKKKKDATDAQKYAEATGAA
jgi:replicative DNA helicase